ncbi:hypothetical protein GFK90_07635 [Roseibium aggregatum]|nr:hypothetical protein GFK90_07635 [Roseibium aggregatum]
MAFLYLDDSKHHRFGFSMAALVACDFDPSEALCTMFEKYGYDPSTFEFKSSAKMKGDGNLQRLRLSLKQFIARNCTIAICVVGDDRRLGAASLELLSAALKHPGLNGIKHEVFFDEGLFSSVKSAEKSLNGSYPASWCHCHFEQNSVEIKGIQLADVVAHTCATMLLDSMGYIEKKVTLDVPGDSAYDGLEVDLGFEMWAGIRYSFLRQNKPEPKDDFEIATVDVFPWGLFVDESVDHKTAAGAMDRFAEMYLGCIH